MRQQKAALRTLAEMLAIPAVRNPRAAIVGTSEGGWAGTHKSRSAERTTATHATSDCRARGLLATCRGARTEPTRVRATPPSVNQQVRGCTAPASASVARGEAQRQPSASHPCMHPPRDHPRRACYDASCFLGAAGAAERWRIREQLDRLIACVRGCAPMRVRVRARDS